MQTNPVKAIREHCLSCCCGISDEVKKCKMESCSLYAFRFGKNPYRTKKELTEEQKMELASRLQDS